MTRRHLDALKRIGITKKNHYSEDGGILIHTQERFTRPPAWGVQLYKNGVLVAIIQNTPRNWGGDGQHYIKQPGVNGYLGPYPRQLDAVMAFVQRYYNISDEEIADRRTQTRRASMRAV